MLTRSNEQRIKGAIDRSIAEEQARQKALASERDGGPSSASRRSGSLSRTSSTQGAESPARRQRVKKPSQDVSKEAGDGSTDTDPAIFEAAFVIDDTDEGSTAATPRSETPAIPTKESTNGTADKKEAVSESSKESEDAKPNGEKKSTPAKVTNGEPAAQPPPAAAVELSPEIRTRLKKLEKLEKTYPGQRLSIYILQLGFEYDY
jgi:hypothetical protein